MAKAGRTFQYQRRSNENVRERANMRSGDFDTFVNPKVKMYKVRDGKNIVRVLPPTWENASHYGFDLWINYGIGADNQSYLSLSKMQQASNDPIAAAKREAERDGDKDLAKALAPKHRIGVWLIDRLAEDEGPQFWAAPFTWDKDLANHSFDEDTREAVMIDDPEQGCDVRFYKEGQGMKTTYDGSKMKLMKPGPIHEDESLQNEWLEYVSANPIPDILKYYSADHIATVFDGQARVDRDGQEQNEKETARKAQVSRAAPGKAQAQMGEEVGEEDDEVPKSARSVRGKYEEENTQTAPKGRTRQTEDEEGGDGDDIPPEPQISSIRQRLAARRQAAPFDEEGDAEPPQNSRHDRVSAPTARATGGRGRPSFRDPEEE